MAVLDHVPAALMDALMDVLVVLMGVPIVPRAEVVEDAITHVPPAQIIVHRAEVVMVAVTQAVTLHVAQRALVHAGHAMAALLAVVVMARVTRVATPLVM